MGQFVKGYVFQRHDWVVRGARVHSDEREDDEKGRMQKTVRPDAFVRYSEPESGGSMARRASERGMRWVRFRAM